MASNDFDFNIQNYTTKDLIVLLNLDTNTIMNNEVVNQKCEQLKQRLYNSKFSTSSFRQNVVVFLEQVKQKLNDQAQGPQSLVPKMQNNFLYDTTPNSIFNVHMSPNTLEGSSHSVIMPKVVPVQNVSEYEYPKGVMNGIEKRVITKIVAIDSLFRENYANTTPSNFTFNFPELINNVVSMSVSTVELPTTWYTISRKSKNNFFNVTMTNMVGTEASTQTVYLPDGNYTNTNLVSALNNYFQNMGNGLQYLVAELNTNMNRLLIRIRNDNDSGGITPPSPFVSWAAFIGGSNFSFVLDFLPSSYFNVVDESPCTILPSSTQLSKDLMFCKISKTRLNTLQRVCVQNPLENNVYSLQNTLGWYMGFRQKTYTVTRNSLYSNMIGTLNTRSYLGCVIGEAAACTTTDNYVFVEINDYHNNAIANAVTSVLPNSSLMGKNIVARIPITQSSITQSTPVQTSFITPVIDYSKLFKPREYLGPIKMQKVTVRLLNRFGQELVLNDNNWSIALELNVLYS